MAKGKDDRSLLLTQSDIDQEASLRRTFAIISHPDAGKTTLTEKFLLYSGQVAEAGAVKARAGRRNVTSDWMDLERQRGISITSTVLQFRYRSHIVNLLDTPGHRDFSEDTYRVLAAVDSGHATIEAAYTSQFQNHLRAVLDWPLGSVEMKVPGVAMANILGSKSQTDPRTNISQISDFPSASLHLYAKKPVPGRKLGHVTMVGENQKLLLSQARRCAGMLSGE